MSATASAAAVKFAQGLLDVIKQDPNVGTDVALMQGAIQRLIHECGPELANEVAEYAVDQGIGCCSNLLSKLLKKKAKSTSTKKAETTAKPIPVTPKKN